MIAFVTVFLGLVSGSWPGPVFLFPATNDVVEHGNCLVMRRLSYTELLDKLTRFKYGYAGAAPGVENIDDLVTNKFWDYLAAGCKVLTPGAEEMGNLARNWGNPDMSSELIKMEVAYGLSDNRNGD